MGAYYSLAGNMITVVILAITPGQFPIYLGVLVRQNGTLSCRLLDPTKGT